MGGKGDVRRLIKALCDGDLNSPARCLWSVDQLILLGEYAECES